MDFFFIKGSTIFSQSGFNLLLNIRISLGRRYVRGRFKKKETSLSKRQSLVFRVRRKEFYLKLKADQTGGTAERP